MELGTHPSNKTETSPLTPLAFLCYKDPVTAQPDFNPFRINRHSDFSLTRISRGDLTIHYSIRLSPDEHDFLEELATQAHLTIPTLIRKLISKGLESKAPLAP